MCVCVCVWVCVCVCVCIELVCIYILHSIYMTGIYCVRCDADNVTVIVIEIKLNEPSSSPGKGFCVSLRANHLGKI